MNILITAALEQELGSHFQGEVVVFTGVGKVNAAYALTKAVIKRRPDFVFNLGTAGSRKIYKGSVLLCTKFYQRDMDVSPLGFPIGVTPYSKLPRVLNNGFVLPGYSTYACSSGDNFVTTETDLEHCDVLDMEAYSLALVCQNENIPFICLKYITDGASETAASDWQENLKNGPVALYEAYKSIREEISIRKMRA